MATSTGARKECSVMSKVLFLLYITGWKGRNGNLEMIFSTACMQLKYYRRRWQNYIRWMAFEYGHLFCPFWLSGVNV